MGLLYASSLSAPQHREKRKQGLQPSEIKGRDERLSDALDFIYPLGKKKLTLFPLGNKVFSLWENPVRWTDIQLNTKGEQCPNLKLFPYKKHKPVHFPGAREDS
jgi:hypothetical protein